MAATSLSRQPDVAETARRFSNHPRQEAFLTDRARFRLACAGIGGGKSEAAAYDVVRHMLKYPKIEALVAAPSYRMIYRSGGPAEVVKRVARWWGQDADGKPHIIRQENRGGDWIEFRNGSKIWYCYAAEPDSMRASEVSIFWLDEAAMCPDEAFTILIGRCRQAGPYPHRGWLTTTPRGQNWVYKRFVQSRDEWDDDRRSRYGYHHWTTYQNPGQRPDDLHAMEEAYGLGTDFYRQEMLAEFVAFRGLVYARFDRERHVLPAGAQLPSHRALVRVVAGVDWGVTSPGCILVVGVDDQGVHWWLDEVYERGMVTHGEPGNDWLSEANRLRAQWGIETFYCDPEDANARLAWVRAGLPVVAANNSRLDGVRQVQALIAGDRLRVVAANCPEVLSEFGQYHWRTDRDGEPLEDADPAEEFDHGMDAGRYAEMGLAAGHHTGADNQPTRLGIIGSSPSADW